MNRLLYLFLHLDGSHVIPHVAGSHLARSQLKGSQSFVTFFAAVVTIAEERFIAMKWDCKTGVLATKSEALICSFKCAEASQEDFSLVADAQVTLAQFDLPGQQD